MVKKEMFTGGAQDEIVQNFSFNFVDVSGIEIEQYLKCFI